MPDLPPDSISSSWGAVTIGGTLIPQIGMEESHWDLSPDKVAAANASMREPQALSPGEHVNGDRLV